MTPFEAFAAACRGAVEEALDACLPAPAGAVRRWSAEAMRYSVMAGGKRLRPMLVLAAADAVATARGQDDRRGAGDARCRRRARSS